MGTGPDEYVHCDFDECSDFIKRRTICVVPAADIQKRKPASKRSAKECETEAVTVQKRPKREAAVRKKHHSGYQKLLMVPMVIVVLLVVVILILNKVNSKGEDGWKQLEPYFAEALEDNNELSYSKMSLDDMAATLKEKGFDDVSTSQGKSDDNTTITSGFQAIAWSPEQIGYSIECTECHKANAEDWYERLIIFKDTWVSEIRHGKYQDESHYRVFLNQFVPLPLGIELGDSFDEVCDKLGITEEMEDYASHYPSGIYVTIQKPGAGGEIGAISVSFKENTYRFGFNGDGKVLNTYTVKIRRE